MSSILWLNNLEEDRQYARWPSAVRSLLQVRLAQMRFNQEMHPNRHVACLVIICGSHSQHSKQEEHLTMAFTRSSE